MDTNDIIKKFFKENQQYIDIEEVKEKRQDILDFYKQTHELLKKTKSKSKKIKRKNG